MTFIPQKTQAKLAESFPKGSRHAAMFSIAVPLLGNGLPPSAVFATLREKFPDADKTDKEISDVISWCQSKNPTPSGFGNHAPASPTPFRRPAVTPPAQAKAKTPTEHSAWWLSDATMDLEAFKEKSQLRIPADEKEALILAMEMLYQGPDSINIVCKHLVTDEKARPFGGGQTLTRDEWLDWLREKPVPQSAAGAWMRPNPCAKIGSGKDGSIMDSDIQSFRFLLVESDVLPFPVQLALFTKLKLPIAAVITSGGASAHAWVRLDAANDADYTEKARRILTALAPFGIDQANKNPSRLSRLPGAVRKIGAAGDGLQRLLWINPGKAALTTEGLKAFEDSLLLPAIQEKPFKKIILDSINRYEELAREGNKNAVATGFTEFDHDNAGLRNKSMTVIAAETNGGKTSLAINILYNVLVNKNPAALFTLEMDRDEIADICFARHCEVHRNNFNTGRFHESEMHAMINSIGSLAELPLHIYDDSSYSVAQIRETVLTLVSQAGIKLVVIDYAQIVMPEFDDKNNREQQISNIAKGFRRLAKDAGIPLIVLSQLNDDGKLRESRVLAHESHNVFLIENHEEENRMVMKVVKGRRIQKKDYELEYEPRFCKITSKSPIARESTYNPD